MNIVFSGSADWWMKLLTPDGLGISWLLSWPVLSANLLFFCVRPALFVIFSADTAVLPSAGGSWLFICRSLRFPVFSIWLWG